MNKRKLLFITEGEVDEPEFIDKIFKKCYPNIEYEYYSYSTSIHTLTNLLFTADEEIDNFLDIRKVLKENEKNKQKTEKLSEKYRDIILVFDFDPHSDKPEFKKVKKMLSFFDDSADNGKLYINYPMMQAYKHIKSFFDDEYKDRVVEVSKCSKYKNLVGKESIINDLRKYNFPIIMKIIGYNLKKVNYILNNNYNIPSYDDFYKLDLKYVYQFQCKLKNNNKVSVLNTFVFNMIEYNPRIVLKNIQKYEYYEFEGK